MEENEKITLQIKEQKQKNAKILKTIRTAEDK